MSRTQRHETEQRLQDDAENAFTSEGGFVPSAGQLTDCSGPRTQAEREREMQEYCISHDGAFYHYNGHRYDRLEDAVGYARLVRARPLQPDPRGPFKPCKRIDVPTDADRTLMASLDIHFEGGTYRFGNFRYDHLVDAANYAVLQQRA